MNKNGTPNFGQLPLWKLSAIGLVIAAAMVISACEAITNGDTGAAGSSNALSLVASRTGVGAVIPINDADELALIGNDDAYPLNGDYQLGADLDLTDWIPIGYNPSDPTVANPFIGQFDGAKHTITISDFDDDVLTDSAYLGIFAKIGDGTSYYPPVTVSNLTVNIAVEGIVTSAQYLGGLVGYTDTAAYNNINVTIGQLSVLQDPATPPNLNGGGVAGYAASASFTNVQANINMENARVSSSKIPKWEIWRGDGTFRARAVIDSIVTETGTDGVTTGGIAGYAENSQFRAITATGYLYGKAVAQNTPVYVGGVAGFATGTNIDDSHTDISVNGEGPGYNTSGGGVAGYISGSRVRNSYAEGPVDMGGISEDFGFDYSWQVYAGGLIGYAGGSNAAPSLVDHSYATGTVASYAPYPYAGGLVGYLYGYNDFTNPAKNGSTVSRSYATGNVSASVQPDTAHSIADIPYAGGLVGYSSVADSTIQDSYATGSATATTDGIFAWAGGIVGGNANNAIVLRTYATGAVTSNIGNLPPLYTPEYSPPGPAAGGIAGFNYYTADTLVGKSVALNENVYGDNSSGQDVVHRVVGSLGDGSGHDGILNDTYANIDMSVGDVWQQDKGLDNRDGADVNSQPSQALYAGLDWDFTRIWQMTGNYPTLR
jgi:hypothetical protein